MNKEREEAAKALRENLKPGDTVYTILRHVSRSGMLRHISVLTFKQDAETNHHIDYHWNYSAAKLLGLKRVDGGMNDSIAIGGCGTDMGFEIVYGMGARLFPHGFGCPGKGCMSNDHTNGDRDYTPHTAGEPLYHVTEALKPTEPLTWRAVDRKTHEELHVHWHRDGGYAFRHRWL